MRLFRRQPAWSVEMRWKEEVVYWEGHHGFVFDGGWGVEPAVTYLPPAADWDAVVPGWLRGRRAEIVERLESRGDQVVEDAPYEYPRTGREVFSLRR